MNAIMNKAIELSVWVEPANERTALDILKKVDLSQIIPHTTRQHRKRKRLWSTSANDYCYSQSLLKHLQVQSHDPPDDPDETSDDEE